MIKYSAFHPNTLTFIRLLGAPVVLPALFVTFLPLNILVINIVLSFVFGFFCMTDCLDGYLARKMNKKTDLGAMLDPIADKFLLYATLIGLLAAQRIHFIWVLLLIGREFFIMALRQVAQEHGVNIEVVFLGKLKTICQMIALMVVIINPYHAAGFSSTITIIEQLLLCLASVLSISSGYWYYQFFTQKIPLFHRISHPSDQ